MQYNFNIEMPEVLLTKEKHDTINYDLLKGKTIVGLCGYKKSGKDAIAKHFVNAFDFERMAFADILKQEMNNHMIEAVRKDLGWSKDEEINFFTEDQVKKPALRPYIIWFGEKLRSINGRCFWINRAFENVTEDKIVISDVRRLQELEIFEGTISQWKKKEKSFKQAKAILKENIDTEISTGNIKPYRAYLFHVNQLGNIDNDVLTMECIRVAQEKWLFDDNFYLDPRIPESKYDSSTKDKVVAAAKKFGIRKLMPVEKNQISLI